MENNSNTKVVKKVNTALSDAQSTFLATITETLKSSDIDLKDDQRQNVMLAIQKMYNLLTPKGLSFSMIGASSILNTLESVATLNLNISATPAECYITLIKTFDEKLDEKGYYRTDYSHAHWAFNFGIQGAGYRKLVEQYGIDVDKLYSAWTVRENDNFVYPHYKGIEMTPPEWTPTGKGKVIRVVQPIRHCDGYIEYLISEREDVKNNLLAHISNNLIRDQETLKQILDKCKNMTIDQILDDAEICASGKVSPAWRSPQSRESMITTKMKNNILRNYPKNFNNSFISAQYDDSATNEAIGTDQASANVTYINLNDKPTDTEVTGEERELIEGFSTSAPITTTEKKAVRKATQTAKKEVKEKDDETLNDEVFEGLPF